MIRAAILFIFLAVPLVSEGAHWDYDGESGYGPQNWHQVSKHCSERHQSPINIEINTAKKDPGLKGLTFTCDNNNGIVSGKLINNGHAPELGIDKAKGTARLTGGPLGDSVYRLQQSHFHFGCEDARGSEHTVNGKAYSGELHLVTYNTKYPDFKTAADKPDGLSVIGVFLKENDDGGNLEFRKLTYALRRIRKAGASFAVNNLSLYKLVPELNDLPKASFYSYKGSLTTPPCYQSVSWIVLKTPISVDEEVLEVMMDLYDHKKRSICDNFRPTQPLNGRTLSKYSG